MAVDVFLSHRGVSKEFIVRLAEFLEQDDENPLSCWYAPRNIEHGRDYPTEILKGIKEAKIVLVYLTDQFEDSSDDESDNYVNNEVQAAREHKKKILTVFQNRTNFPDSLNIHLNNRQTFSMDGFDSEKKAMEALQVNLLSLREHNILQNKFADKAREISKRQDYTVPGFIKMSGQMIKDYQNQFIQTRYFKEIPKNQQAFMIFGPPQSGKTIHAVNYLLAENKAPIYEATSMDGISTLLKTNIPKNAGFIIRSNGTQDNVITAAIMDTLVDRLKAVHSTLVLCASEVHNILPSYKVDLPSERYELVAKKVQAKLLDKNSSGMPYLDEFKQNVPEESLASISIIEDYVTQIITAVEHDISMEVFVHTIQFIKNNRLSEMFSSLHVTELLYPLAVSLNPNRSYKQIYTTYLGLCAQFKEKYPDITIQNMDLSKSEVIKKFELKTSEGIGNNHLSSFMEEKINFSIPHLDKKVWPIVWQNHPILHRVLSDYLIGIIDSKKKYHVTKASEIMEDILQDNLHENMEYILSPLARSDKSSYNIIASELISRLAENPKYSNNLFSLVKIWLHSHNLNQVDTALFSLLSSIGIDNLSESIFLLRKRIFDFPERSEEMLQVLSLLCTLAHYHVPIDTQLFETLKGTLREYYLGDQQSDLGVYRFALVCYHALFVLEPSIYFDSQYNQKEKLLVTIESEIMKKNEVEVTVELVQEFLEYCKQHPMHKEAGRSFYLALKERCVTQGLKIEFNQLERLVNN